MAQSLRTVTVQQLLIVVFAALRDAGRPTVARRKFIKTMWEMRAHGGTVIPTIAFDHAANQPPASTQIERILKMLHQHGIELDKNHSAISISPSLSALQALKPLYDAERDALRAFAEAFVRQFAATP